MELSEKYKIELININKAVSSFEAALNLTFENLDTIWNFSKVFYPIHRKEFTKACFSYQ
jgi:hypothetical protein